MSTFWANLATYWSRIVETSACESTLGIGLWQRKENNAGIFGFFRYHHVGWTGGDLPRFYSVALGRLGGVGGVSVNVRVHLVSMLMLREGRLRGWGWGWGGGVGPC